MVNDDAGVDAIIEKLVKFVADALDQNMDPTELQNAVATTELPDIVDVELILIAGRILHEHRRKAPPKKTLIRRVP